jgi:hypothetical protein
MAFYMKCSPLAEVKSTWSPADGAILASSGNFRWWGIARESRSLGAYLRWPLSLFLSASCPHDVNIHGHTLLPPWCTASLQGQKQEATSLWTEPPKQQAKINSSFLKWLMSGFVTVTGKVTKESSYFKSKFFYHFLSLLLWWKK